jgi:hypothetical protein
MTTVNGKLLYQFADPGENKRKALAYKSIKLVEKYYMNTPQGMQYFSGPQFPGAEKILATATTDGDGGFTFSYMGTDTMGLIKANTTIYTGGGEFINTYVGDLYRVARVIVEDPATSYYCSPDNDIVAQPFSTLPVGYLTAFVRSYDLQVTVMPAKTPGLDQVTQGPLAGINVFLLRQNRPYGVPEDEGQGLNQPKVVNGTLYFVVSQATTDQNGVANFTRAVKNIGDNDQYYIWCESDPTGQLRYFSLFANSFQFTDQFFLGQQPNYTVSGGSAGDGATYNSQYTYLTVGTSSTMEPLPPYISGNVYRSDNQSVPIWFAPVELDIVPLIFPIPLAIATNFSDQNGHFAFDGIKTNYDANHQQNSVYILNISAYGYRDTTVTNLGPLKWGLQDYIDRIYLQPASHVHGTVVDDNGNPVNAHVTIGQGSSMYAASTYTYKKAGKYYLPFAGPAKFDGPAVLGNQLVVIDPDDKGSYFAPETTSVNITSLDQDLGALKVYTKEHRIKIQANQYIVKGNTASSGPAVQGAHVTIKNVNPPLTAYTDANGNATFAFQNSSNTFDIEITAPDGQDYIGQIISADVPESKDWTLEYVYMQPATHIFGKVYAGRSPVADAHVFMDEVSSSPIETYTDNDGNYILHNIPFGIHKFKAAKSESNFIGDSMTVDLSQTPSQGPTQGNGKFKIHSNLLRGHSITDSTNFYLTVYGDMDITNLLGIPIEVETLDSSMQGVKISGSFIKLPGNAIFSVDTSLHLGFTSIFIIPGSKKNARGIPLAEPKVIPVSTDQNTMDLHVYGKMLGAQKDPVNGIRVDNAGNETGIIQASVYINAASFSSSSIKFDGGQFSLVRPDVNGNDLTIPTIVAGGSNPMSAPNGLRVATASGGSLHYQIYGFDANADSSKSFVNGDTVRLATTLHTNLEYVTPPDIHLYIGDVLLHTTKLDPLAGEDSISIPLEKWSIVSGKWGLSSSGFMLDGAIRTGSVDVPFTGMQIAPTKLQYGSFSFGSLNLAGVVPLTVTGKASFGYDNGVGHWSLNISPVSGNSCATLTNLPGTNSGDLVSVNNFRFASDGTSGFTIDNTAPPLTIYKLGTLYPTMLKVYSTYVSVPGTLDLHIPMVSNLPSAVNFANDNGGKLALTFQSVPIAYATKGVKLNFPGSSSYPETFNGDGFIAKGTVIEDGKFQFNVTLYRTTDSTSIWIDPGQSLNISSDGSTKLTKVSGNMLPSGSTDWTNLQFAGDMTGATGATGRLQFTVYGDIVASNQQIGVKNVSAPFGGLSFTYDFPNHQLVGHLDIDQTLGGEGEVKGTADAVIDQQGWYFVAGGSLTLNNPHMNGNVGIMFGSHSVTADLKKTFLAYSYKGTLPPAFRDTINGFYFEGEISVPVIIPSVDIDLGIISGHLFVNAGADIRMGMNFSDNGNSYYMGLDGFIDAGFGVGGSIVIACGGISVEVLADVGFDGLYNSNGTWSIDGNASITLTGTAYCGWGVCDSDCNGTFCDSHSASISKTLGVHGHIGTDGESFNFYFE